MNTPDHGYGEGVETSEPGDEPSPLPTCANCDGEISEDDLVCPHCGIPLIAG